MPVPRAVERRNISPQLRTDDPFDEGFAQETESEMVISTALQQQGLQRYEYLITAVLQDDYDVFVRLKRRVQTNNMSMSKRLVNVDLT